MATQFARIEESHRSFIAQQKIFFVASAAPAGRVNVSPKGMGSFRVLGDREVAYLDCTGSGSETRAHLLACSDSRLTIMFCAFDGEPVILRLYGQGKSLMRGSAAYQALISLWDEMPGARQIVTLSVDLVQTSCGYAVPLFDYVGERSTLTDYWTGKGDAYLRDYWGRKNMTSLDGLPTGFEPATMLPAEA